jgi:hypothetical protein
LQHEAEVNPEAFFKKKNTMGIADVYTQIQRVPIFSVTCRMLDNNTKRGQFILHGLNNFTLQGKVSQSLGQAIYRCCLLVMPPRTGKKVK